jgi:hypothetical protein
MRTLSSTLANAVSAQTQRPYITLTAEDQINYLEQSFATGSNADALASCCVANDDSIIRAALTRDNSGLHIYSQNFQWQRITDPTNPSQWQSWTIYGGGSGNMAQDSGCCISNNNGTLRAFAQQGTSGNAIFVWTSTNNGVSWSTSPTIVLSPPSSASTKGIARAGNNDVFFIYDVLGGNALGCSFYSGSWSALHSWTLPTMTYVGSSSGIAAAYNATLSLYYVIYSDLYALHECTASSNGATWTALPDIAPSTNQSMIRQDPRLQSFDGLYTLSCIEADSGAYTGSAYQYPRVRQSADLLHWSNGFILHDMPAYYGASYLKTTPPGASRAIYVASTMQKVELGKDFQASDGTQYRDLSTNVLEYHCVDELGKPSTLSLVLDDSSANLVPYVASYGSNYAPLGLNTTLVLSEGYRTGQPPITPEAMTVARYRIKQLAFERAPGRNQLTIEAVDLTHLLDLTNRYQITYVNQTLAWMLSEVCARAGFFHVSLPTTSQMSTSVLTFVLHAGRNYRQALDELCRVGWLEYFLDQNEILQFRELSTGDSVAWRYTPEIETLTLGSTDVRTNHVIVTGKPPTGTYIGAITNGEAYDDAHMHTTGIEHVLTASDAKLSTAAVCSSKAAFLLAQEQRDQLSHNITVPLNPALQVLDVIQLSDNSATRRSQGALASVPRPASTKLSCTICPPASPTP